MHGVANKLSRSGVYKDSGRGHSRYAIFFKLESAISRKVPHRPHMYFAIFERIRLGIARICQKSIGVGEEVIEFWTQKPKNRSTALTIALIDSKIRFLKTANSGH